MGKGEEVKPELEIGLRDHARTCDLMPVFVQKMAMLEQFYNGRCNYVACHSLIQIVEDVWPRHFQTRVAGTHAVAAPAYNGCTGL